MPATHDLEVWPPNDVMVFIRIHFMKYLRGKEAPKQRLCGASAGGEVAAAALATSGDLGVLEGDVRAAAITAKNVVVVGVATGSSTLNIDEVDAADVDAFGRRTGRAAVEVVLLDINAVGVDVGEGDVLVSDVGDGASGVGVGLDAAAI